MTVKLTKLERNISWFSFMPNISFFTFYQINTWCYVINLTTWVCSKEYPPFHKKKTRGKTARRMFVLTIKLMHWGRHARKTVECPRNGKRRLRDKLKACRRQPFRAGKHTEKIRMVGPHSGNLYRERPGELERLAWNVLQWFPGRRT